MDFSISPPPPPASSAPETSAQKRLDMIHELIAEDSRNILLPLSDLLHKINDSLPAEQQNLLISLMIVHTAFLIKIEQISSGKV